MRIFNVGNLQSGVIFVVDIRIIIQNEPTNTVYIM